MVSARWEEIKFVFEMAVSKQDEKWPALLADACGEDARLAEEVLELLIADRQASSFLEVPAISACEFSQREFKDTFDLHEVLCGRFEILALLGEGGMGQVYEALDLELGETIAIKTIRRDIVDLPGSLDRFKREVFATRKVTHSNVCRTFDLESHTSMRGDVPHPVTFLTMELLQGETLAACLHEKGPLGADEVRLMAKQLASALQAAHRVGIVHCDLKPANIFLTRTDFGPRAVITDFGIARLVQQSADEACYAGTPQRARVLSTMAGTPMYMAPEQGESGACTPRSDIYSLGLVLFEALTGPLPVANEDILGDVRAKMLALAPVSEKPQFHALAMWTRLLSGCLQCNPENRFSDISQVLEMLEEQEPDKELSAGWMGLHWHRRWWMLGSALGLVIAAVMLGHTLTLNATAPARTPSVAVLAFADTSHDPALQELSKTIAADLTSELAQFNGLRVSSQSLVSDSDSVINHESVGHRLNVDKLLSGSITHGASGLVEKVELVDAKTGILLWSGNYERSQANLTALEQDIAEEVAFQSHPRAASGALTATAVHVMPSAAKAAYDRGQSALGEHTATGFERAVDAFQQTIDADPQSAAANAALADVYIKMASNYNRPEAPFALMANAEKAARRALQLDSASAPAYCSLAQVELLRDYNWSAAEASFKRATELDPTYVRAHTLYATLLLTSEGRFGEARDQFDYPHRSPDKTLDAELSEVLAAYYARQFDSSIQQAKKALETAPNHEHLMQIIAMNYMAENKPDEAIALLQALPPAAGEAQATRTTLFGLAYIKKGQRKKAYNLLNLMESSMQPGSQQNVQLASLAAALGDHGKAMMYLERSYAQRQMSVLFAGVDPLMDPLHSDPRFQQFLVKLHPN